MVASILDFSERAGVEEVQRPLPDQSPLKAKYQAVILSVRVKAESILCEREGCLSPKSPTNGFSVEYRPVGLITHKGARVPIPPNARTALKDFRARFNVCLACVLQKIGKSLS